jgi:small-conductance mechanosensitive channel
LIQKFGRNDKVQQKRQKAITKLFNIISFAGLVLALSIVWGYTFQSLYVASIGIFTLIGIAFFAVWSILSNITSGFIMFFKFPMSIGDTVEFLEIQGARGVVQDISLFHVLLEKEDGTILAVPNNVVIQKVMGIQKAA